MLNISNKEDLKNYLIEKEIVEQNEELDIKVLAGGVSGDVIKVSSNTKELVVKQALAKLKVKDDWFSDPKRIITEKNCLQVYNQIIKGNVPELYFFDDENYIYGMEAAPEESVMWKTQLLSGKLDFKIAQKVILSLAKVHDISSKNKDIKAQFINKDIFYELRIEPYFETVIKTHNELKTYLNKAISTAMEQEHALVHGDFSPKNILVNKDDIYILDFEVANFGAPAFDLAFFTNHFLLKAIKNKMWSQSYLNMMQYMTSIYFENCNVLDKKELEEQTINMLAGLFIARVDGKSPAEYITEEEDKILIRNLSYSILKDDLKNYNEVVQLITHELAKKRG